MKKPLFLPPLFRAARATGLAAWQTGQLFRRVAQTAFEAVQEVLRAEVQKGNAKLVADFLADKAMPAAKALLLEQISARMAARLLVKIGLRGALASNVVGWVLPVVVERIVRLGMNTESFRRLQQAPTVTNALRNLDELKRRAGKWLSPDAGSGAEVLPDDTAEPLALLPSTIPRQDIKPDIPTL